jgi:hypothetical protein
MDAGSRIPENIVADLDDGETLYYVCRYEGSMLAERVDDGVLSPPEQIGSALPGTHGSYVLLNDTVSPLPIFRAIVCMKADSMSLASILLLKRSKIPSRVQAYHWR